MVNFHPIKFLDTPAVFDCGVTPVPGASSAPLQVIADSGTKAAFAIDYIDGTNEFIGVYSGNPGQEQIACIIGGGVTARAWVVIGAHSRVSLRSMTLSPITIGSLMMTLVGF